MSPSRTSIFSPPHHSPPYLATLHVDPLDHLLVAPAAPHSRIELNTTALKPPIAQCRRPSATFATFDKYLPHWSRAWANEDFSAGILIVVDGTSDAYRTPKVLHIVVAWIYENVLRYRSPKFVACLSHSNVHHSSFIAHVYDSTDRLVRSTKSFIFSSSSQICSMMATHSGSSARHREEPNSTLEVLTWLAFSHAASQEGQYACCSPCHPISCMIRRIEASGMSTFKMKSLTPRGSIGDVSVSVGDRKCFHRTMFWKWCEMISYPKVP